MGPDPISLTTLEMEPQVETSSDDSREGTDSTDPRKDTESSDNGGVDIPSTDEPDLGLSPNQMRKLSRRNEYMERKLVAKCLVDFALFAANISQLRFLLAQTPEVIPFYYFLIACVGCSLIGQIVFALIILVVWERESRRERRVNLKDEEGGEYEEDTEHSDSVVEILNLLSVIIVFIITMVNVCITGFGITMIQNLPNSTRTS